MNKKLIVMIVIVCTLLIIMIVLRIFLPEDDWICINGEWIKHGNPSVKKPSEECKE